MKRSTLFLTLLLSMLFMGMQAQDTTQNFTKTHKVVLIARAYGDSIVLRWAPQDPAIWMLGNSYGWYINRSLSESEFNQQTGENPEVEKTLNYGKPITPYTLEEMQTAFDSTNLFAGAAAQALYGKGDGKADPNSGFTNYVFRKDQEQHQRQFLAYLAAEGHPDIATALGLRFVDYDVKNGQWYEYTLSSPIPERFATLYEPSILVENKPYVRQEDEMMPAVNIKQIDEYRAIIYWQRNKLSGYYVERSMDGRKWEKLNTMPVYGYDPDEGAFAVHGDYIANMMYDNVVFFDSLLLKHSYKYRVRGFDAFGDYLPFKESEKFEMIDAIPPVPAVILGCFSDDPAPGLVFVLRASAGGFDGGTKKKPSPFLREAMKIFSCVEFPYESESRLSRWMERHFAEYGLGTDPGVTARILASAGRSMYRLQGEVAKIGAYAAARGASSVTAADVEACVARTDEEDAFALANAILAGDTGEALRILNLKKSRREDPGFVLAQVTRAMNDLAAAALFAADGRDRGDFARSMKMNEYRAGLYYRAATAAMTADPRRPAAAAEACEEAERQMKTGAAGYLAVERLICSPAVGGAR